jgi:inositol phosphorylceramide mannosyltransferase catalytic subunit
MENLNFEDLDKYLLDQNSKIIHQIWFGIIPNKISASKALKKLKPYRDSWITKNPSWCYICWDLDKCYKLIKNFYPHHLEMYKNYPYHIQRCDTIRYLILHRYGGLYADMDYYCNRSWNEVVENFNNEIYLVETPNNLSLDKIHISNSLMYSSKPGNPFWSSVLIEMEMKQVTPYYYSRHVVIMFTTGPGILNRVFNKFRYRYKLSYYPYKLFHPYGLQNDIKLLPKNVKIYAVHLGKGTWESKDSKFIIFLYQEYKILLFIFLILLITFIIIYRRGKTSNL